MRQTKKQMRDLEHIKKKNAPGYKAPPPKAMTRPARGPAPGAPLPEPFELVTPNGNVSIDLKLYLTATDPEDRKLKKMGVIFQILTAISEMKADPASLQPIFAYDPSLLDDIRDITAGKVQ